MPVRARRARAGGRVLRLEGRLPRAGADFALYAAVAPPGLDKGGGPFLSLIAGPKPPGDPAIQRSSDAWRRRVGTGLDRAVTTPGIRPVLNDADPSPVGTRLHGSLLATRRSVG